VCDSERRRRDAFTDTYCYGHSNRNGDSDGNRNRNSDSDAYCYRAPEIYSNAAASPDAASTPLATDWQI